MALFVVVFLRKPSFGSPSANSATPETRASQTGPGADDLGSETSIELRFVL